MVPLTLHLLPLYNVSTVHAGTGHLVRGVRLTLCNYSCLIYG